MIAIDMKKNSRFLPPLSNPPSPGNKLCFSLLLLLLFNKHLAYRMSLITF